MPAPPAFASRTPTVSPGAPPVPPAPSAGGPSEYTRVMQGLSMPPAMATPVSNPAQPQQAPGAPPAPAAAPAPNVVPIVIVVSAVVILVVAVVLYFALR